MGRSLLGFHPPHFSEDAAWLPAWLQPFTNQPSADDSPSARGLEELGCLPQSISTRENGNMSDDERCKSFRLFLSGEDNSPMNIPSCSSNHEVRYHLHLSSNEESQYSMNPVMCRSQSEKLKFSQTLPVQQPEAKVIPKDHTREFSDNAAGAYIVPSQQKDNSEISLHESPSFKELKAKKPIVGARSHKVNINDAFELAIAASEALEIHEAVKNEPNVTLSIGLAVLEAALRVKQARLMDCKETLSSSAEESNEDDFDFLSDLDEMAMADAYEDVGLTVTDHGDIYESVSHVKDSYASENYLSNSKQLEVDSGSTSSKEQLEQVNTASVLLDSHEGDTLKEPTGYKALGTENADQACNIDPVVSCSVKQADLCIKKLSLEREGFGIGDVISSRTILRSSLHSGSSRYNEIEREDKTNDLVPERFQSRWFGGWTSKNELSIPAVKDDKYKRNIPEVFANETSFISESADIAPDMNSCMQKHDNEHNIISQSSVAPKCPYVKSSNTGKFLSDDVAISPIVTPERTFDKAINNGILPFDDLSVSPIVVPEHTNDKASNSGNLLSDDVAVSPNMSPVDPLCSVVPCSFTSNSAASQNSENQVNLENHLGPTAESNLENQKRVSPLSDERSILKINGEGSPTVRRRVVTLKSYSMLYPRCDPYLEKEHTRSECLPFEHAPVVHPSVTQTAALDLRDDNDGLNQTRYGDTELTSQMEKETNLPITIDRVELQSAKVSRKVYSSCKSYLVPRRKRVRFTEPEINFPQIKKFKKTPGTKLKDPLVANKLCRRIKSSNLQPKSRPHDNEMFFQDLKFLLTGFSVKKHKQIKNLIRKNGGIVYDDIPSSTSRRKRCIKLPLILCPKRLLTTKFLYACAVNACILKVKWLFDSLNEGSILPPKKYLVLKEHASENYMVIGKPVSQMCFIFDNIAIMLHGKPDFCCKMAKVIKHGGGLVFKTFHWLVKSIESKKVSVGIIVVEDENGVSRQLKQCALEQGVPMMPFSWIVNSLYAGRLLPSPELKIPDHLVHVELSEEI